VELVWTSSSSAIETFKKEDLVIEKAKDSIPVFSKQTIDSVKEGQTLRVQNINFYGGRHIFLPQSSVPLNELLETMKTNATLVIEIQGHICCFRGPDDGIDLENNERNLSLARAKAVYDFLVDNGIDASRMSYQGFAGRFPLVDPEYTEEDRTTNRRVEIKIIKK
jgi:outer membrane protein OmpA-like peptidoglycan-associated protein